METMAFSTARTPTAIMENGRKRAPEYRTVAARPAETDKDGEETRAARPAYEEPGDRLEWLAAVRCSQPQQLVDTMRGMYHEGTQLEGEISRLRDELKSAHHAVKSFAEASAYRDKDMNKDYCLKKRYRALFWTTLVGSSVAIPSLIGVEVYKKHKALKEQAQAYAEDWEEAWKHD